MSIAELSSTTTGYPSTATEEPEAGFERRWTAWMARGYAHERAAQQRFVVFGIGAGTLALAAVIGYGLLPW